MMQLGTRRTASPHSLGSTASSGKWNSMGAHCPCSEARYPTRSTRALASMTALYDAKRAQLNNKIERSCWPGSIRAQLPPFRLAASIAGGPQ